MTFLNALGDHSKGYRKRPLFLRILSENELRLHISLISRDEGECKLDSLPNNLI